jgi:hypothetical protein
MLKAAQIAVVLGRDLDYGAESATRLHRSEAVRISGHLCDSLLEAEAPHRAINLLGTYT